MRLWENRGRLFGPKLTPGQKTGNFLPVGEFFSRVFRHIGVFLVPSKPRPVFIGKGTRDLPPSSPLEALKSPGALRILASG